MITINEIKNAKILIVDDNDMNITLLQKILKQEGYINISSTTNPLDVESLYKEYNYDIILLDLNMPIMDGFDIMRMFKENFKNNWIPILVLTAQNDQATKIRCLSLGAKDFLTKPIDKLEAINRIKNIIETKLFYKALSNQNIELEKRVLERTKELQSSYDDLTECLKKASRYKDSETGNHVLRMSNFSKIIAKGAGFDEISSEHLRNASALHDIGKIGIPDNILNKPGTFNPEEWIIMKTHTTIGFDILSEYNSNSLMVKYASEIALYHHEKWDGTGYPKGLKGEDIPFSARIVALADVFDALTTERPYKKPWSNKDAIEYINKCSGSQFDPKLIEIFNNVVPEILEMQGKYK